MENEKLRNMLKISQEWTITEKDLKDLESESFEYLSSENSDEQRLDLTKMISKAVTETKKRISKKEKGDELNNNKVTSCVTPDKIAAYKNMKPKTVYLLGSPESSDEEDEAEEREETVIKNVKSKYLF